MVSEIVAALDEPGVRSAGRGCRRGFSLWRGLRLERARRCQNAEEARGQTDSANHRQFQQQKSCRTAPRP